MLAIQTAMPLRIFISHSSKDKMLAAHVKEALERFGLEVFVAHEDITPSEEWLDKIRRELKRAHVFLALLTKHFRKSLWTDQEFGIALTSRAVIMPIRVDLLPYGFMSKHQALRLNPKDVTASCLEIALAIDCTRGLRPTLRRWLIHSLSHSEDFKTSIECSKLLNELKGPNQNQVNEVILAAVENDQVYKCSAAGHIETLFEKHKNMLWDKTIKSYESRFKS